VTAGRLAPLAVVVGIFLSGCGGAERHASWPLPNGDLAGTRAAAGSSITAGNVAKLHARWRFRFTATPSFSGIFASTPVVDGDTVYVQDLRSNVFALDPATGAVRWSHLYNARNDGPNGLTVSGDRVYGATDSDAFALDAKTGRELWSRHLTGRAEQFVDVAPVEWDGVVYLSTVGYLPFGRGAMYGLDAATGTVRWKFVTIKDAWKFPREAGGGGLWYPVSIDNDTGRVYAGNSNPSPWGGSPRFPNGAAYPGPVLYTDSLLVLDAKRGGLLWYDQVTPHDVRDHDFQATPILATHTVSGKEVRLVFGAGKSGRVIAWDRESRRRLWVTPVGIHRNDLGPLPERSVPVCPGLLGGVETPMAYADGRLFVPVVDLCSSGSAVGYQTLTSVDPSAGKGRLVALDAETGDRLWERRFPSPNFGCATVANDVVFTSTYDGNVYAFATSSGKLLWRAQMRTGINACPAVVGDRLLVGAGVPRPNGVRELVAFGL
jgi:outer membrane protein assembly factor BamB